MFHQTRRLKIAAIIALVSGVVGLGCIALVGGAPLQAPPLDPQPETMSAPLAAAVVQRHSDVVLDPRNTSAWNALAEVYEAGGRSVPAIDCYRASLQIDDQQPQTWYRLALNEEAAGQMESAELAIRSSIRLDPNYAPSRARLGHWLLWQGRLKEAETQFSQAIALDKRHTPAWLGVARICLLSGQADEAISILRDLDSWSMRNATQTLNLLAAAYRAIGDQDQAIRTSSMALRLQPVQPGFDWDDPWSESIARASQGMIPKLESQPTRMTIELREVPAQPLIARPQLIPARAN